MSKKTLKSKHTQHANNRLETRLHDTLTAYRSLLDIASSNKLLTESECTDRVNQFVALNEESRHIVMCCTYHFGAKTMPNVYAERWTAKAFSTSKNTGYRAFRTCSYRIRKAVGEQDPVQYLEAVVQAKKLDALLSHKTSNLELTKQKSLKIGVKTGSTSG